MLDRIKLCYQTRLAVEWLFKMEGNSFNDMPHVPRWKLSFAKQTWLHLTQSDFVTKQNNGCFELSTRGLRLCSLYVKAHNKINHNSFQWHDSWYLPYSATTNMYHYKPRDAIERHHQQEDVWELFGTVFLIFVATILGMASFVFSSIQLLYWFLFTVLILVAVQEGYDLFVHNQYRVWCPRYYEILSKLSNELN